jgi:hypothetical protein
VEAHDIDILAGDPVLRDEGGHGFGVGCGDGALRLAQDARSCFALRQMDGLGEGLEQDAALGFGIGPVAGRAECLYPPAIGFDQSDVDPVKRGAAHQTECGQHHGRES